MRTFRKAACVSSILLSACAPNCPPPKVQIQVEKVPIATRCIDPALLPPEPATIAMPIDARLAADLAASQAKDLRKWGRALMALIGPCTTNQAAIER